ncbi:MAG: (d)CMP kinase [Sphaerochaetaceae bacterium]|nr:(d)CMP kinase [Sphaerochaetaceae bacterium]
MVIAIDGPAGVGKSSVARMISQKCGFYYLNSGLFYRAIAYNQLLKGLAPHDRESALKTASSTSIDIKDGVLLVDGVDLGSRLRTQEVGMAASIVSSIPELRNIVNRRIREIVDNGLDIVAEGRDMTTVVFPDAQYKFYFDAKPSIRAKRRFDELGGSVEYDKILKEIEKRDNNDRNKVSGALKVAENAVVVDTSDLTISQVCDRVLKVIKWPKNK